MTKGRRAVRVILIEEAEVAGCEIVPRLFTLRLVVRE
jgi:hypothetical protein